MATRFTLPAQAGAVEVFLRDGLEQARWRFILEEPGDIVVDYLDPALLYVERAVCVACYVPRGFIPTPRLRFDVNGVVRELVSDDQRVLERHYSRPRHQEMAYARPDRWVAAYHAARVRQVRRLLRGVRGRVCDIGSGYSLVAMAGPWPFSLSACDRDLEAVAALRARGVDAHAGSAEAPPFPEGDFDAVFAGEVVEHLSDPHGALRRWVELLRPGGTLIVTTPNRRHLLTRARGFPLVENPEHLFEWDVTELRAALRRAGAAVIRVEGLALPLPFPIPARGWRDLVAGLSRRAPVPQAVLVRVIEAGRPVPRLSADVAVVARRIR